MNKYEKCPDCATDAGKPHNDDCDIERCSACGTQRLTCNCEDHDPMATAWEGEWRIDKKIRPQTRRIEE